MGCWGSNTYEINKKTQTLVQKYLILSIFTTHKPLAARHFYAASFELNFVNTLKDTLKI